MINQPAAQARRFHCKFISSLALRAGKIKLLMKKSIFIFALLSLAPGPVADPLRYVREGNTAYQRGELTTAAKLYTVAADSTDDPGLIAFNLAAVLAAEGEWRMAEQEYLRCLADRECPGERRNFAEYNRGVCLLKRGGKATIFRVAINCFESVLDSNPGDPAFLADVRYNLELAKLLWQQARLREAKPPAANDLPPEEERQLDPPRLPPPELNDPNGSEGGPNRSTANMTPATNGTNAAGTPNATDQKTAGAGTLAPLPDQDQLVKRSPEDTRTYLVKAQARLDAERRANAEMLAGPERKGVRDW